MVPDAENHRTIIVQDYNYVMQKINSVDNFGKNSMLAELKLSFQNSPPL